MSVFDEVLAAHHEAAHAVAVLAYPTLIGLHDLHINGAAGKIRYRMLDEGTRGLHARAVVVLAGIEVDPDDVDGPEQDEANLAGILDRLGLQGDARSRQVGKWRAEVVGILRKQWRLHEAITNRLVEAKRLTADQIKAIARRVSQ